MKKQTLINLTASATEYGGGWMRDKNSGTIYNANVPTVEQSSSQRTDAYKNSFGGGWAHDSSGILYKSDMSTVDSQAHSGSKGSVSGSLWAKNYMFGESWHRRYDACDCSNRVSRVESLNRQCSNTGSRGYDPPRDLFFYPVQRLCFICMICLSGFRCSVERSFILRRQRESLICRH